LVAWPLWGVCVVTSGSMRMFHYSNIGNTTAESNEDAVVNFFDLLALSHRCGNGQVDNGVEECDVQADPDGCSCSCRMKCPPYFGLLQQQNVEKRWLASLPDIVGAPISEKYLHRGFDHNNRVSLYCKNERTLNIQGTPGPDIVTYHGDLPNGMDMVLCGHQRSGNWTPPTMDCWQDCDPTQESWWNDTNVAGGSKLHLVVPPRPTRIRSGEIIRMECAPHNPVPKGMDTYEVLFCNDGFIDPLGLPCKSTCPRDILMPPFYKRPVLERKYVVEGEGYQDRARRIVTCKDGYAAAKGSPFEKGVQESECIDATGRSSCSNAEVCVRRSTFPAR